jgi:sugar lactone lactonase YvrE
MTEIKCILDARARLGEGPVWSVTEQALYWVDILAPALHRLEPASGATRSWTMPAAIGSFGLREHGGAIVALRNGIHLFDFASEKLTFVAHPEAAIATNRFTDGKVSPDGRFWVGTMDDRPKRDQTGALYRFDPDGSWHKMVGELYVSNGLAWSPDGRIMYHSDSTAAKIWAYDYDLNSGAISHQRVLAEPTNEIGRPDGAATDHEGYYWSAGVSAGTLNRWSPDGKLERQIDMPCSAPTMPCFGGPELKTLYITSLTHNQPADKLAAKPLSGGIFAIEVDVPGVPIATFKG